MKKVIVLGGGESGVGSALLAKSKGFDVFLSEYGKINDKYKNELIKNNISFEEETHSDSIYTNSNLVIKSPGIPEDSNVIKKFSEKDVPIVSEIEFASMYTNSEIIAITGTNGKTTTSLLTYHILKTAGLNVQIAGNIGNSFAREVIEDKYDYYVLEISSFQLDDIFQFQPNIGIITNITPDHLDRYNNDINSYVESKFKLVKNQSESDYFIYNIEDKLINENIINYEIKSEKIPISINNNKGNVYLDPKNLVVNDIKYPFSKISLKGEHNYFNCSTAIITANILNISKDKIIQALETFKNAPHRLEEVREINGITFINDSKGTNTDSTLQALKTFKDKTIIWIAGGQDKGNNYSILEKSVRENVKSIICLGKDNKKIIDYFKDIIPDIVDTNNIKEAVEEAYDRGEKGDIILFSPACASFDLFKNYEERGNLFKEKCFEL